jgi:hypothetical protein
MSGYSTIRSGSESAFVPACAACGSELPRVIVIPDAAERSVLLECACGFVVSYVGEGYLRDRRAEAARPPLGEAVWKRVKARPACETTGPKEAGLKLLQRRPSDDDA